MARIDVTSIEQPGEQIEVTQYQSRSEYLVDLVEELAALNPADFKRVVKATKRLRKYQSIIAEF